MRERSAMEQIKLYSPVTAYAADGGEKREVSPQEYLSDINRALREFGKRAEPRRSNVCGLAVRDIAFSVEQAFGGYYLTAACTAEGEDALHKLLLIVWKTYSEAAEPPEEIAVLPVHCKANGRAAELQLVIWNESSSFVLPAHKLEQRLKSAAVHFCRDCKYLQKIANTDETNAALCTFAESYEPVYTDQKCRFIPEFKPLCCGDCDRLGRDSACCGCRPDDPAESAVGGELCMMFEDKRQAEFERILAEWKYRGEYDREKIERIIDEFEKNFRTPFD